MPSRDLSDELEEYWRDLRIGKVVITPEAEGPEAVIDRASAKVEKEMVKLVTRDLAADYRAAPEKYFVPMLLKCFKLFAHALYEEQSRQDVSLLIQLFLESSSLPAEDAKGFLRALPRGVINRILKELGNSKSGLHALLSIEALWRDRSLDRDYEVRRDPDGKLVISFHPREVGYPLSFRLKDLFESAP